MKSSKSKASIETIVQIKVLLLSIFWIAMVLFSNIPQVQGSSSGQTHGTEENIAGVVALDKAGGFNGVGGTYPVSLVHVAPSTVYPELAPVISIDSGGAVNPDIIAGGFELSKSKSVVKEGIPEVIAEVTAETEEEPAEIIESIKGLDLSLEGLSSNVLQEILNKSNDTGEYKGVKVGDVYTGKATFYCKCYTCCEKWSQYPVTASGYPCSNGTKPKVNIIACNWLPYNSIVKFDGVYFVVKDRGGGSFNDKGRLDVFVYEGHSAALKAGRHEAELEIISIGDGKRD